jgi:hypothetical protein
MPATRPRPPARGSNPGGFGHVFRDPVMAAFALVALGYMTVYQQAFTTLPIAMHAACRHAPTVW